MKTKKIGGELMRFALNTKGQIVYVDGDQMSGVFSSEESHNYSLCQIGVGFALVPVWVVEGQIQELKEGKYTEGTNDVSYSVFVPHQINPALIPQPYLHQPPAKSFTFFMYEGKDIVPTSYGLEEKQYSKEEAEEVLGRVTLIEVKSKRKRKKYYVSEVSRIIAEEFKEHIWCTRIIGLGSKDL